MKRTSEAMGKTLDDIITKEVYNRLKKKESFRMNLETMELEEIPECIDIPTYKVVVYSVKKIRNTEAVVIHDFLDIIFPYEYLNMEYKEMLKKIKFVLDK